MKKLSVVFTGLILMFSTILQPPLVQAQLQRGPRSPYLDVIFYTDPVTCFNALRNGEIDIMPYPVDKGQYDQAISDPNILLAPYSDSYDIRGFNFNTNETIEEYFNVTSPLSRLEFRKALAFLVDKTYIISQVFGGLADRIDVPFPKSQEDWWNTSVTYPNYPYEYSWTEAAAILDAASFVDRDGDGIRNYPIGWYRRASGMYDLDPVVFCVEKARPQEMAMANWLRGQMEQIGIPVDWQPLLADEFLGRVVIGRNYHICAGSQVVYRAPTWWYPIALMAFTTPFEAPAGAYPEIGPELFVVKSVLEYKLLMDKLWKATYGNSWEVSIQNVKEAQGIFMKNVTEIPVCSIRGYFAYRKTLAGIVDEKGFGIDNSYTFLNAYRTDNPNQPVRVGLITQPTQMNILYSTRQTDYTCLDRIYAGLIDHNPYDPNVDTPWIAQDWEVGSWIDPDDGKTKTFVDYYFRKDAYWVKPTNGTVDGLFNATDYEFTCHYIYAQYPYAEGIEMGCPHYGHFKDIHHIQIINDFCVRVFMDVSSVYAYQWPTYPLLPKHKWLREPLAHNRSVYLGDHSYIELPGTLPLNESVVSGLKDTKVKVLLANGQQT